MEAIVACGVVTPTVLRCCLWRVPVNRAAPRITACSPAPAHSVRATERCCGTKDVRASCPSAQVCVGTALFLLVLPRECPVAILSLRARECAKGTCHTTCQAAAFCLQGSASCVHWRQPRRQSCLDTVLLLWSVASACQQGRASEHSTARSPAPAHSVPATEGCCGTKDVHAFRASCSSAQVCARGRVCAAFDEESGCEPCLTKKVVCVLTGPETPTVTASTRSTAAAASTTAATASATPTATTTTTTTTTTAAVT